MRDEPRCPQCDRQPMIGTRLTAGAPTRIFVRCPWGHVDVTGVTVGTAMDAWREAVKAAHEPHQTPRDEPSTP